MPMKVDLFDSERTLRKVKRHSSVPVLEVDAKEVNMIDSAGEVSSHNVMAVKDEPDKIHVAEPDSSKQKGIDGSSQNVKALIGGASDW